jgi:transcriptional regulator with XRE-family HTH domain
MSGVSGAVLRLLRERAGIGLRAVARRSKGNVEISDSHLSRVERGHRPVTPAVLAAYERSLGMRITAHTVAEALADTGGSDRADRTQFHTRIVSILLGAPGSGEHGDEPRWAAEEALLPPAQVGQVDITHVEQAAALVRRLDLRFGGTLASHIGRRLLRWALRLRTATMSDPTQSRLHTALGSLACWTAWAAFDAHHHDTARTLWSLALEHAITADQPDLRAHVLADIAASHNHHQHPADALHLIRLADGDERTHPAIRTILHGVRAHAYATLADPDRCTEQIKLAEDHATTVDPDDVPAWLGGWQPAQTHAMTAHATATLAIATGDDTHHADAHDLLTSSIDQLSTTTRTRALALTQARLAALNRHHGDTDRADHWLAQAGTHATDLRSARLNHHLTNLRADTESPAVTPGDTDR